MIMLLFVVVVLRVSQGASPALEGCMCSISSLSVMLCLIHYL